MSDKPSIALRKKKDNSIIRCIMMLAQGNADAAVSAGNTGAVVSIASYFLGRLKGVKRPGVAAPLPAKGGCCVIIDLGANIACKAQHLLQYGVMASAYAEEILKIKKPRVGLLNVGKEDTKGNSLIKDAHKLLQKAGLNYVGYVEGHEIFLGGCDVAICEGFVGNTLLKSIEGFSQSIIHSLLEELGKVGAGNEEGKAAVLKGFKKRTDWSAYGGAPLLGVNGVCILAHGKSNSFAIANSISVASQFASNRLNDLLLARLA
jgi:glycerol-3-phosphate acyltransferase PlsX